MSNIKRREEAITEGSIADIARRRGTRLEAVMADADIIVMLDISSSMATRLDGGYGYSLEESYANTRFSSALDTLSAIQRKYQGRVLVITFNNSAEMLTGGLPTSPSGGTDMHAAMEMAKEFDGTGMKLTIISDGEPSNVEGCVAYAATFETPIDTIFIGNDNDVRGLEVMNRIAAASRGQALGKVNPEDLSDVTVKLLGGR